MKCLPLLLVSLSAVFLPAARALADPVVYTYTGNPFTDVSRPYTTSDFLSITATFASPLAPNLDVDDTPAPLAYTVSDGVNALNNTDSYGGVLFDTDANGNILGWNAIFTADSDDQQSLLIFSEGAYSDPASSQDISQIFPSGNYEFGEVDGDPGTWAVGTLASSTTPEPSSFWLLATGAFAGVGTLSRRRKQSVVSHIP